MEKVVSPRIPWHCLRRFLLGMSSRSAKRGGLSPFCVIRSGAAERNLLELGEGFSVALLPRNHRKEERLSGAVANFRRCPVQPVVNGQAQVVAAIFVGQDDIRPLFVQRAHACV